MKRINLPLRACIALFCAVVMAGCKETPTGVRVRVQADPAIAPQIARVHVDIFVPATSPQPTDHQDFAIGQFTSGGRLIAFPFSFFVRATASSGSVRVDASAFDTTDVSAATPPLVRGSVRIDLEPGAILQTDVFLFGACVGAPPCSATQTCGATGTCHDAVDPWRVVCDGSNGPCDDPDVQVRSGRTPSSMPDGGECTSSIDLCDGIDNNCNGMTDEGLPMISCGLGVCRNTIYSCRNGMPAICQPKPAATEVCNGKDDNCDGVTDNAGLIASDPMKPLCRSLGPCAGAVPTCGVTAWFCTYDANKVEIDAMSNIRPVEMKCDGIDGNCDGMTDEPFRTGTRGLGMPCSDTSGSCTLTGTYVCKADKTGTECSAKVTPGAETCDGFDNDCNGMTDDNLANDAAMPSCATMGGCAGSMPVCNGTAKWDCNYSPSVERDAMNPFRPAPVETLCDDFDNNCDGVTDADNPLFGNKGQSCNNNARGVCRREGAFACNAAHDATACVYTDPTPPPSPGSLPEVCNAFDDNCDGATDENDPGGGVPCDTGMPGRCRAGGTGCDGGVLRCDVRLAAEPERCDAIDNDCDGVTDDLPPGILGAPCVTGLAGVCGAGTTRCDPAVPDLACDPTVRPGVRAETCNGLDDDCDNAVDEPGDVGTHVCFAGTPCERTQSNCVPCGNPAGSPEVCNGLDDDCNGQVDDGVSYPVVPHTVPPVACNFRAGCVGGTECCTFLSSRCAFGYYDANGQCADGCECQDTGGGPTCATAVAIPALSGSAVSGTIPAAGAEDWYALSVTAEPARFVGSAWAYDVSLTAGGAFYAVDVFAGGPAGNASAACASLVSSARRCSGSAADPSTWHFHDGGENLTDQLTQNAPFHGSMMIRVRRRASAPTTQCLAYTLRVVYANS